MVPVAHPGIRTTGISVEQTSARAELLKCLFRYLDDEHVPYCAAGDVALLSERADTDVDLVVSPATLPCIPDLLARFCAAHGVRLVQAIRHEQTACFFVIAGRIAHDQIFFLQLDICGDYMRDGRLLLRADLLLEGRYRTKDGPGELEGFYVPPVSAAFMYYLLKRVEKQHLDDRHGVYLSDRWHEDPEQAQIHVQETWPEVLSATLIAAAWRNQWQEVRAVLPVLRAMLHRRRRMSLRLRAGEAKRKIRRIRYPAGLMVAFFGPDGCGKSTVIGRVRETLLPAFWHADHIHLRPGLGTRSRRSIPVENPHGQPPRNPVASVAKLFYYAFDYVVGYGWTVFPRNVQATLVMFDRYYHDLLVDPRRYRYGGPRWLGKSLARIVPDPELSIFLDAPPDVLQRRKQEVPFSECERQRHAYLDLALGLPHSRIVDASRPLPEVMAEVEDAILHEMETRLRRRLDLDTRPS